jgi:hypothetical protein
MKSNIAKRVQKYRDSLRKSGLRPIQIWVPDTRQKGFLGECHRQSRMLKHDCQEAEVLDWLTSVSDDEGWK